MTDDDDRPRVPVYAGDTDEVVAYIPVDPALAAILVDGNRLTLDTTPLVSLSDVSGVAKAS